MVVWRESSCTAPTFIILVSQIDTPQRNIRHSPRCRTMTSLRWLIFDRGRSRDGHESPPRDGHELPGAADSPAPKPEGAIKSVTCEDLHDHLGALLSY